MSGQTCGEILRRCAPQNDTPQDHSDAVLALHEILHLRPALAQNDNPPQIHLGGWHMTCSSESEPPVGRKE